MTVSERMAEWEQQLQAEQTRLRQLKDALDASTINVERLTGAVMAARMMMEDAALVEPEPSRE